MRVEFESNDVALKWVVVVEIGEGEMKGPLVSEPPTEPMKSAMELLARRETRASWLLGRRNKERSVVVAPSWTDTVAVSAMIDNSRVQSRTWQCLRVEALRVLGSIVSLLASEERLYSQSIPSGGNAVESAKKHCV